MDSCHLCHECVKNFGQKKGCLITEPKLYTNRVNILFYEKVSYSLQHEDEGIFRDSHDHYRMLYIIILIFYTP